jgi:magnesium chelatase family protein
VAIRERVERAYARQLARQEKPNAKLDVKEIDALCVPSPAAEALLKNAITRMGFSARAYHRVLKVARTIADLEERDAIDTSHVAEAIQYRRMDKNTNGNF